MHLREGRFVEGRKIRRPPDHCTWYDNPTDGRKMFQPAPPPMIAGIASPTAVPQYATYGQGTFVSSAPLMVTTPNVVPAPGGPTMITYSSPAAASLNMWSLQVQQDGEHVHVFYVTNDNFCAYREGLDFDDATQEGVSALNPEKCDQGCERLAAGFSTFPPAYFAQNMICDRSGVIFSLTNGGNDFRKKFRRGLVRM